MRRYNPKDIEPKWQKIWHDDKLYQIDTTNSEKKFYVIPMFPYPSGDMHVGHWYNFAPTDTIARWRRMMGHNVLHVNGFDAFGLPAENAAIKRNIPPAKWTYENIASMTKQLEAMGPSYDWSKRVITSDPEFYKWTQWLFVQLYKKGMAYKKLGMVNWCPKDQTVLANEQVVGEDNHCERCGTPVIQKELEQWYFKITDYADRLLDETEGVDWPERVKIMQANWIGRSKGALVDFKIEGSAEPLTVFTTRPDTLFGATYMVLAPEHPLTLQITTPEQKAVVEEYLSSTLRKTELERKASEKDKTGVFTGAYAINPINDERTPIWIADYVLMGYGTGAIMAVPAHDQRDSEFAKRFDLKIINVVKAENKDVDDEGALYTEEGIMINSGSYNGMASSAARDKIVADLVSKGLAKEQVNYKLRDWLISRQRYWGTPIPIVYCKKCGTVPVPENQLPVVLPENVAFTPTGRSPLLEIKEFVHTTCPNCDGPAERETDTMDTFVDSSWYFLRYPNVDYNKAPYDPEIINNWGPVDHYIGGIEHAILHLLYSRFVTKFLADHYGLKFTEPFKKLSNQGIILGPDGLKMSKSKGNVVSPDEQVASYGADSLRLYLMFMGPYDQGGPYSLGGIAGVRRFLDRTWTLIQEFIEAASKNDELSKDNEIVKAQHQAIKKVTTSLEHMGFNIAIAGLMEYVNELYRLKAEKGYKNVSSWRAAIETLIQLLAPFAPHISEELWHELGNNQSVHLSPWPQHDEKYLLNKQMNIVIQINGKLRSQIEIDRELDEEKVFELVLADQKIQELIGGKDIKKKIYVPSKLVNLVVT